MPLNHPETGARLRYLPPGSLRRQRRRGRLEGAVASLALTCLIGFALIAVAPAEMYRPAPKTKHPTPEGGPAQTQFAQIPPCTGLGKDCTDPEPEVSILPRVGPQPAPQARPQARTVPEPSTLALIGAGLALTLWRHRT